MVKMQLVVVTQVMVVYVVKMHPVVKTLFLGLFGCCEVFGKVLGTLGVLRRRFGKNKISKNSVN